MYPVIHYTRNEIEKLIHLYENSPLHIETLWDGLLIILDESLQARVYSEQATETETNHHLSTLEHDHYPQYKAMYLDHLEDMPLLINDGDLEVIARWRLEIRK